VSGESPDGAAPPTSSTSAWAIRSMVERVRFTPVRLREGYAMADVDRLLDAVVAAAERGEPVGPVIDAARFTPVRVREGYDMGEVDRFLIQLTGAGPTIGEPGVVQEQRGFVDRVLEKIRSRG
jgi:DivIVA domain-containing protein